MAVEPNEDAIHGFVEISGLARANAVQWLKAHNNDPNNAVIAWMEGGEAALPPPPKYNEAYNEQQFHTDRDGNFPQTQIEASFGPKKPGAFDSNAFTDHVPPTRPSSRVSNTKLNPVYGPENNPNLAGGETYEQQLQRAKEISLGESQTLPGQETGVTYANPYFGPATQSQYDSEKWALTLPEAHTQEILLNPEPPDRVRQLGTPALLKPSSSNEYLAAYIKILHALPLAREALLNRDHLSNEYGRDSEWWDGTPIRGLRVVNIDEGDRNGQLDDVISETQRLMAFLDDTERAYGSIDALTGLPGYQKISSSMIISYLESWINATEGTIGEGSLSSIFRSRGTRRSKRQDIADEYEHFCALDVRVDTGTADRGFSLYEAIDDMVWSTSVESDTFLDETGDVLTFDITNPLDHSQSLGITIPPCWYADRYLEGSLEDAVEMQAEKERITHMAREVDDVQALMISVQKPGSQDTMDVGPLMTKITNFFRQTAEYRDTTEGTGPSNPEAPSRSLGPVIEQLSVLAKRVGERVANFQDIRDSMSERILQASQRFKGPSDEPKSSPTHKYILQGVISKPHLFYVLEKGNEDDEDQDMVSPSAPGHQWWKVEYISSSATPAQVSKVTELEVLNAASTDGKKVILVYASERAMSFEHKPLPKPLQDFVRADNLAFKSELDNFESQHTTTVFPTALSPQKRKAAAEANDSDMEVEHDYSPQVGSHDELGSSNSSPFDPTPLEAEEDGWGGSSIPSMAPARLRPLEPKPAAMAPDARIPASLQSSDQEMQESGRGMLKDFQGGYEAGSHTPQIKMDYNKDEGYEEGDKADREPKA